jgi:hypothetical protein
MFFLDFFKFMGSYLYKKTKVILVKLIFFSHMNAIESSKLVISFGLK